MEQATQALIEKTADEAAARAVKRTFVDLGINPCRPLDMQRDMAALRELRILFADPKFQDELIQMRRFCQTMDKVKTKGILTMVTLIITAIGAIILMGLQDFFGGGG